MAAIVHTLWFAAERARFSCNDRALWIFFNLSAEFAVDFDVLNKDKNCLIVKKTVSCGFDCIARFVLIQWMRPRMISCAPKRMWKITSGVFIEVFLRITLKRPHNKYLINLVRSVITGKSQTSALIYWPRYRSVNTSRSRSEISL